VPLTEPLLDSTVNSCFCFLEEKVGNDEIAEGNVVTAVVEAGVAVGAFRFPLDLIVIDQQQLNQPINQNIVNWFAGRKMCRRNFII
jgi:hypothetical protein